MKTYHDYTFAEHAEHGIGFCAIRQPHVTAGHIDGPLLHFSDGQLHWLGLWERVLFFFGMTDAEKLQRKLRPRLTAELDAAR